MAEKLDVYFAVFNCHINDAHNRAVAELKASSPEFVDEIEAAYAAGIMGIFDKDPTPATKRYAELIMQFVNEGRE